MGEIVDVLFIVFLVGLFLWVSYHQIRVFSDRNFRGYHDEIRQYLLDHSLELMEIRFPNNIDWKDNCFAKPPIISISLVQFRINGIPITWTDRKYKIIDAIDKKGRETRVWLEIETNYFQKPILTFKQVRRSKFFDPPSVDVSENITIVRDRCPACGWKLSGGETECPECELHFQ